MEWITFTLGGKAWPAISAELDTGLSLLPRAVVRYIVDVADARPAMSTPATVTLHDGFDNALTLTGELVQWDWTDQYLDRDQTAIVVATIEPPLGRLLLGQDSRVFQGLAINELVTGLLKEAGLAPQDFGFSLTRQFDAKPYTVQWQESNLRFLARLLAREGIWYRHATVKERGKPDRQVLRFSDTNGAFSPAVYASVDVTPESGTPRATPCFSALGESVRNTPLSVSAHDYQPDTPEIALRASAGDAKTVGTVKSPRLFGARSGGGEPEHMSDVEYRAKLEVERHQVRSRDYLAFGNLALSPGETLSVNDRLFPGDYYVAWASAKAEQPAPGAIGDSGKSGFSAKYRLLPISTTYRPPLIPAPALPFLFSARIETEGEYALLDEQGRYVIRSFFDTGDARIGRASPFFRKATPFAGPSEAGLATGLHLPLRNDVEVIWGALHGDPDRPVLLGTLPNRAHSSPVTTLNPYDNRLRTAGGNELLMRDLKEEETIHLKQGEADAPFNLFELCADPDKERIRLNCKQGAIHLYAKQTMAIKAGDSVIHEIGKDRVETIENKATLTTTKKDIETHAATDHTELAKQNIILKAGQNIELRSGEAVQINVKRNAELRVKRGDLQISVSSGNYLLQANNGIHIKSLGGGDVVIGQNGGYFILKADGTVTITGNKVSIDAKNAVNLRGKVNYQIGAPQPVQIDTALPPPPTGPIRFNMVMTDVPGATGAPLPHIQWRIVHAPTQVDALLSENTIVAGESDTNGRLAMSKAQETTLLAAYKRAPAKLWLVTPGRVRRLVVETASPTWTDDEKLRRALDAAGYTEQLDRVGGRRISTSFHADLAKSHFDAENGSDLLEKLKG